MIKPTAVITRLPMLLTILVTVAFLPAAQGQTRQTPGSFRGQWKWAIYAKSRDELPPAYRAARLREIPAATIYLSLKQRGNKLTGEYSGSRRFLAKLEDGDLDAIVKGNAAKLELQSGFGGTVTVLLTLQGNRLHWKTIKSEGESYFPDDVVLHRVAKPRR